MKLLIVEKLIASYGPVKVLHSLDFTVGEGQISVLLGANGAGKTTTLRALCGTVSRGGRILFYGQNIISSSTETIARLGVAHVPEGRGTFMDFTVEENLRLGGFVREEKNDVYADMKRWCEFFPRLGERLKLRAGSLSGGEQQMLAIARALMMRPRLLLLDEPSLGLAPLVTREVFNVLKRINSDLGMTMFVVEQNANLALQVADSGYVLESGKITLCGEASDIKADEGVRRAYLGY